MKSEKTNQDKIEVILNSQSEDVTEEMKDIQREHLTRGAKPVIAIIGGESHMVGKSIMAALEQAGEKCPIIVSPEKARELKFPSSEVLNMPFEYKNPYENLSLTINSMNPDQSVTLERLQRLNLSPEQIQEILHSPVARMENESQEEYKKRRKVKQLIEKHRHEL